VDDVHRVRLVLNDAEPLDVLQLEQRYARPVIRSDRTWSNRVERHAHVVRKRVAGACFSRANPVVRIAEGARRRTESLGQNRARRDGEFPRR
jgi:hypothetical protein